MWERYWFATWLLKDDEFCFYRVEMRKYRMENQEWIFSSAARRIRRAWFGLLERRWMLRSSQKRIV